MRYKVYKCAPHGRKPWFYIVDSYEVLGKNGSDRYERLLWTNRPEYENCPSLWIENDEVFCEFDDLNELPSYIFLAAL